MKFLICKVALAAAALFISSAVSAQTITINSPASNATVAGPGEIVTVSVSVGGAVAGIQSISLTGTGSIVPDTVTYSAFPPTNSVTENMFYMIPAGATPGSTVSVTASATFYADSPVNTSRNFIVGGPIIPPPANDDFADSTLLNGATGTVTGTSDGATKETGEPNHDGNTGGRSVWFRWTAPFNGPASLDTSGSDFDTILAVYAGGAVNTLSPIASDDDGGTGSTSLVNFQAIQGVTYRIAIDGFSGDSGSYTLAWEQEEPTSAANWALYE